MKLNIELPCVKAYCDYHEIIVGEENLRKIKSIIFIMFSKKQLDF